MKALVPDGSGSVVLAHVGEPTPTRHEVVIAVDAFSVNRGETFQLESPAPGWRPGKDVAGTVVRTTPDASGPHLGARVVAHPAQGGWAERVAVPLDRLAEITDSVDSHTAAALPLAGLTALRVLRAVGTLPGKRLLITGASGGVGHYLVELAEAQGAKTTAVVGTKERGRRLGELGAKVVTDIADADERYDVIVESIGGNVLSRAWRLLTAEGLLVWMGQASRAISTLDFFDWAGGSNATMRKFHYAESAVPDSSDLATLVHLVAGGHLHPQIGRVDHWANTALVLQDLLSREICGKAILEVS